MSNRLGGKQGTAYTGTNANQPPNWTFSDRDPNQYDTQNVSVGDLWLNQTNDSAWLLVSLAGDTSSKGSLASWTLLQAGGGSGELDTLTGDSGGSITPDNASNINITSSITGLTFVGNPGTHSLVLTSTGGTDDFLQTLTGNSGGPVDGNLGNINIIGDGTSVNVVGNPGTNTLTVSLVGGAGAAIEEIGGDTGPGAFPIGGLVTLIADQAALGAGSSVSFNASGNVVTFNVTDGNSNTIVGNASGNLTMTGTDNAVFGDSSTTNLTTGSRNTIIGSNNGNGFTSTESDNILLGYNVPGAPLDSNVLKIGRATGVGFGELNEAFIHGIRGITPGAGDGIPVFIDSNGQLGTVGGGGALVVETLTGNAGGPISPVAGNINIVGDGTSITITGAGDTLTASVIGGATGILTVEGDTGPPVAPVAGAIEIFANNAALGSGSSVSFDGAGNILTLNVTDTDNNTIIGADSGRLAGTGTLNTVLGQGSFTAFTTGTANTIIGAASATSITTGINNTIIGQASAVLITTGGFNTVVGKSSLSALTTGNTNLVLGISSANSYTAAESNNIIIGNGVTGTVGDANALRIGLSTGAGAGQLNKSFIAGIRGITPTTNDGIPVYINSLGQLGTVGTGIIATATGNTGGAVPANGLHNINIVGDNVGVTVVGNPGTNTLTVSLVGGGGGASIEEIDGDSGVTVVPTNGVVNIITDQINLGAGKTVAFVGTNSNTLELAVTDSDNNTIIGDLSGRLAMTGDRNVVLGSSSFTNVTSGFANTVIGYASGASITGGSSNTIIGGTAGTNITVGTSNTLVGRSAAAGITTGSNNTIVGIATATAYTSSESNNIMLGAGIAGAALESNTLRIGAATGAGAGQINKSFIHGIRGITPAVNDGIPVYVNSLGQLGTVGTSGFVQTLTGNSGGARSPVAGNINIVGDGTTATVVGSGNTLTISAISSGGGSPAFLAYLANSYTFATGAPIQITCDTVVYNLGGAFNTFSSTFTAPTTGFYNFSASMGFKVSTAASRPYYFLLVTSSRTYVLSYLNSGNVLNSTIGSDLFFSLSGNVYARMTAGDTATLSGLVNSGIGASIIGTSGVNVPGLCTFFSGELA